MSAAGVQGAEEGGECDEERGVSERGAGEGGERDEVQENDGGAREHGEAGREEADGLEENDEAPHGHEPVLEALRVVPKGSGEEAVEDGGHDDHPCE